MKKSGLTLIYLMLVIALLGLVGAILIPIIVAKFGGDSLLAFAITILVMVGGIAVCSGIYFYKEPDKDYPLLKKISLPVMCGILIYSTVVGVLAFKERNVNKSATCEVFETNLPVIFMNISKR